MFELVDSLSPGKLAALKAGEMSWPRRWITEHITHAVYNFSDGPVGSSPFILPNDLDCRILRLQILTCPSDATYLRRLVGCGE